MNILLAIYGGSPSVTFSEIFIASLIFLSRNFVPAAKYSYFSPFQLWERQQRLLTPEETRNTLMLSGWLACPPVIQLEELNHSFQRLGIRENEKSYATFVGHSREQIAHSLEQSVPDDMVSVERWKDERAKGRLHIRLLCLRIVQDAVASIPYKAFPRLAFFLAVLHCCIPFIVRVVQGHPLFGVGWAEPLMILFALLISLGNFAAGCMFVLVGLIDYRRRVFMMHRCSALLMDPYLIAGLQTSRMEHPLPLLNFSKANNVGIWLETRQIFKDFGCVHNTTQHTHTHTRTQHPVTIVTLKANSSSPLTRSSSACVCVCACVVQQWFYRVQAYSSAWALFIIAMILYLFYQLLFKHSFDTTGVTMVAYDMVVIVGCLFVMLLAAKTLNKQHVRRHTHTHTHTHTH